MSFRRLAILFCLSIPFADPGTTMGADDWIIETGKTETISTTTTWTSGTYDNRGTLRIEESGIIHIYPGVSNTTPLEDLEGLNLGVVSNAGTISSEQTVHFLEGSTIEASGAVFSEKDVYFHGSATVQGHIEAEMLVFGAMENGTLEEASLIDFGSGAYLDVDNLVIYDSVRIVGKIGEAVDLHSDLVLGKSGASLVSAEDLVVHGNYASANGSTLIVKPGDDDVGQGSVTFKGGGEQDKNGYNNIINQSHISAALVRLENNSKIGNYFTVRDALELGADSLTRVEAGIVTGGKLTLEEGASLDLVGDESAMAVFSTGAYNGVFLGGFELQKNATLRTPGPEQYLQLAVGADSKASAGSSISATSIFLYGINSNGGLAVRKIENRGDVAAEVMLSLTSIQLLHAGSGTLEINSLQLTNSSVLHLASHENTDGGLKFTGTGGLVSVGYNSSIDATGKTIDFGSTAVTNWNASGGIIADRVLFGDGGSYMAERYETNSEAGVMKADATFAQGSTLVLHSKGYADFGDNNILFETGSNIELRIESDAIGSLVTTGKIETQKDVVLKIKDGSNFDGRTKAFVLAVGNDDSTFHEELSFADSLFFDMVDHSSRIVEDEHGNKYNQWIIEVIKTANLVDYASSENQRNLGTMIDRMIEEGKVSPAKGAVYDVLMEMTSDAAYRNALDQLSGSIRENAAMFALSSPWRRVMDNIGYHRLSLALVKKTSAESTRDGDVIGQAKSLMPSIPMSRRGGLAHDLWFHSYYHYDKLDSDANTAGGEGHRGGFALGSALPTGNRESLIGLSFGYSDGRFKQTGDKVSVNDFQIGVYAGANLLRRNLQLRGYVGYGIQKYAMDRSIQFDGLKPQYASGNTDGTSISAALLLIRPVDMSSRWLLKPTLGIDFERLEQDGFQEWGNKGILWGFEDLTLMRTMMRFGVSSDYAYRKAELTGRLFYGVKVAGDNAASSRHFDPGQPSYGFDVSGVSIGSSVFDIGLGGNLGLNADRTSLLFLDYSGAFTRKSNSHTASLGILWKR